MNVYKKRLPEGERKRFGLNRGVKCKILNSLYYGKDKDKRKKEAK